MHQASRLKNHLSSTTPASSSRRMTDLVVVVHWGVNELAVVVIHLAHKDKYRECTDDYGIKVVVVNEGL